MRRWLLLCALLLASPVSAATKFYFHESAGTLTGYRAMDTTIGTGVTTAVTNTVTGPTAGVQMTKTAGGTLVKWTSCPIDPVTISGTVTVNAWASESAIQANAGLQIQVMKFAGSEGAPFLNSQNPGAACQASGTGCTEISTTNGSTQWTATPTSTTFAAGDRIVVKWYINDASGSMGTGRTTTFRYDATTTGASGDSWVQFSETVTCTPPIQPSLVDGFDGGQFANMWTAAGTSTPTVEYEAGAWWARFNPSASTEYVAASIASGTQTYTQHLTLRHKAFPASGEQWEASAYAGANRQAGLTISSDGKLRVHFGNLTKECTANSLYKFTDCTVTADCPVDLGGNPGEADCTQAVFAQSATRELNTTDHVALVTTADTSGARPYDVNVAFYLNGYNRGSQTRWEGVCSGGTGTSTPNTKACGATSDCTYICDTLNTLAGSTVCTAAGTCGQGTTIGNVTAVRLGADESSLPAADYLIRDAVVTLSNTDQYARYTKVVPQWPVSDATPNQWNDNGSSTCGTHALCVDDTSGGGALDSDVLHLMASVTNDTEVWNLTHYAVADGETVIAAVPTVNARMQTNTCTIEQGLKDAGSGTIPNTTILTSLTYSTFQGAVSMSMPSNGAWIPNDLKGYIRYVSPGGSSFRARVSNFVNELLVALPPPVLTDYFPDVNGDGNKTLCVIGDSIMNDPELYDALNGVIDEAQNILKCAKGGQKIGDLDIGFGGTSNWTAILNGSAGGYYPCSAERGNNAHCDIAAVHIGANETGALTLQMQAANGTCEQRGCLGGADTGKACSTSADCASPGVCTDEMGPQQGASCDIPEGTNADSAQRTSNRRSYCIKGDQVGQCCAGIFCSAVCGGPGGCASGANLNKPCTDATKVADCGAGVSCQQWSLNGAFDSNDADANYTYGWCQFGSNHSPACPRGTCIRRTATSYLSLAMTSLIDQAAARTGDSAVKLVLLGNTDPYIGTPKFCVGGSSHGGVACLVDGECGSGQCVDEHCTCLDDSQCASPGKCKLTGAYTWESGIDNLRWFSRWLQATARDRNMPFFDLGAYQRRVSPSANAHLRDFIHQSSLGQTQMADGIKACVTRDTNVPENKCGDLYVAETCPRNYEMPIMGTSNESGRDNRLEGSGFCTPTGGSKVVDAIVVNVANVPTSGGQPVASVQCSVYTLGGGFTATKVNAGCDTGSTLVTQAGWLTIPTVTPDNCVLSAGTNYWIFCNTNDATLQWTENALVGPARESQSAVSYGTLPSSFLFGVARPVSMPWYLAVH